MKKLLITTFILLFSGGNIIAQAMASRTQQKALTNTIVNFLKWYKVEASDTSKKNYSFTKGGYPDTTTKVAIDMDGIEIYLNHLNQSGFFSETYLNELRYYFKKIDIGLQARQKENDLIKIDGLDRDWILETFEPEMILDHIKEGRTDKITVVYNKAIVRFRISKIVQLLFTMTKSNKKWLIDYIGYDNTYQYSLGKQ
jgi:hypothetical protein